ncbi:MAG: hypothetical protein Q8R51_05980 [Azonexus sp.]|nr:hypothetical protein [Azonexus sp.]
MQDNNDRFKRKLKRLSSGLLELLEYRLDGFRATPAVIEDLQTVIAGGNDIAHKLGMSEINGLNVYGLAMQGKVLDTKEAVRQLLLASDEPEAFADTLRKLADEIEKSPSDDGAGA